MQIKWVHPAGSEEKHVKMMAWLRETYKKMGYKIERDHMIHIDYDNISKYKYRLKRMYCLKVDLAGYCAETDYLSLNVEGYLLIRDGYCWDGPSGPTIDTENFIRASLVHDALYQLIRDGHLIGEMTHANKHMIDKLRKKADKILYKICREDGMSWFRAKYVYRAVRWFGGSHVK